MTNSQITLADYIGHILQEVNRSRAIADQESLRIAQVYASDELLKYMTAPRFVISEMDVDLPVVVSNTSLSTTKRLEIDRQQFVDRVKGELDSVLQEFNSPLRMGAPEMTEEIQDIYTLYQNLTQASTELDILKTLQSGFIDLHNKTLQKHLPPLDNKSKFDSTKRFRSIDRSLSGLQRFVMDNLVVDKTKLDKLWIDPTTQATKSVSTIDSLIRVKMKITEDAISVKTITDNQGNERRVLNFN